MPPDLDGDNGKTTLMGLPTPGSFQASQLLFLGTSTGILQVDMIGPCSSPTPCLFGPEPSSLSHRHRRGPNLVLSAILSSTNSYQLFAHILE